MRIVAAGAARSGPIRNAEGRQAIVARMPASISCRRIERCGPVSFRTGAVPPPE